MSGSASRRRAAFASPAGAYPAWSSAWRACPRPLSLLVFDVLQDPSEELVRDDGALGDLRIVLGESSQRQSARRQILRSRAEASAAPTRGGGSPATASCGAARVSCTL